MNSTASTGGVEEQLFESRAHRFLPRYTRANRSRVFYTTNLHLHLWFRQPSPRGEQTGLSLKQRRCDNTWRHWTAKVMRYGSAEKGAGMVHHFEIGYHDSLNAKGDRVKFSKRYIRLKICL